MAKFNILLFIILLNSLVAYACVCVNRGVTEYFQQSDFVAKAKIIKITPDPNHDAELEQSYCIQSDAVGKDVMLVKHPNKKAPETSQMLLFCYYYEKDTGESYVSLF